MGHVANFDIMEKMIDYSIVYSPADPDEVKK